MIRSVTKVMRYWQVEMLLDARWCAVHSFMQSSASKHGIQNWYDVACVTP